MESLCNRMISKLFMWGFGDKRYEGGRRRLDGMLQVSK